MTDTAVIEPRTASGRPSATVVAAALIALAGVVLLVLGHGTTFYFDDWNTALERTGWSADALLDPHNEHLIALQLLLHKVALELFGLDGYWALRVLQVLAVMAMAGALYAYARLRVGPVVATGAALAAMLMGGSYWDLIWPFQLGFDLALACGIGMLVAFDRGTRRGDLVACALLAGALASASLGISLLLVAAIEVLWRSDRVQRLWIVAVPAVLYGVWYLAYGAASDRKLRNLGEIPGWIADAADDAAGAALNLGPAYGAVLVVALVLLLGRRLALPGPLPVRLIALVAAPLSFWALTAWTRAGTGVVPAEPRYLLPGGLWLGLIAIELARDRGPDARPLPALGTRAAVVAALGFAFVAAAGINALDRGGDQLRAQARATFAATAALDAVGPRTVPAGALALPDQPQLRAGTYATARATYGDTPAPPQADLAADERAAFDAAVLRLVPPAVAAATRADCDRFASAAPTFTGALPGDGLVVRTRDAPAEVRVRALADALPEAAVATVPPGTYARITPPRAKVARPWVVDLRATTPLRVCAR